MAERSSESEDSGTVSNDINLHVGRRIVARRKMLRISQDDLGRACQISGQQVWKYENGVSGMSAARLMAFSEQLHVPVSWFFEDLEPNPEMPDDIVHLLRNPRGLELLRLFNEIPTDALQDVVINLATALRDTVEVPAEQPEKDNEEQSSADSRLSA